MAYLRDGRGVSEVEDYARQMVHFGRPVDPRVVKVLLDELSHLRQRLLEPVMLERAIAAQRQEVEDLNFFLEMKRKAAL